MKDRLNYWVLLAQLNPLPVAIGAGLLFLIVGLFISQRRRARATRRSRPSRAASRKAKSEVAATTATSVESASAATPESAASAAVPVAAVAAGVATAAALSKEKSPADEPAKVDESPVTTPIDDPRRERVTRVSGEVKNLLAGSDYDQSVIGSDDRETRQLVGAELLAALVGRSAPRRERAREAFMKHGYFDDATHDLRIADSSNERAAAARRLSFVHDREATPHLIGALDDSAPDVRRAAVEALMDLRDPAAIGPLNSLMQTENDRKVPRTVIKSAIEACATSSPVETAAPAAASIPPPATPEISSPQIDSEREVIEL
jgi:HEAT repeat protein